MDTQKSFNVKIYNCICFLFESHFIFIHNIMDPSMGKFYRTHSRRDGKKLQAEIETSYNDKMALATKCINTFSVMPWCDCLSFPFLTVVKNK